VPRVDQKQRVQAVAAREEIRHARKKHGHVAVKAATRRARMTNADAVAKDVRRLAVQVVRHLAVKGVRRLVAKDVRRLVAKVVLLPATKVVPLRATKVAQHRVARAALELGWKRLLVVAVTRSRLLRVVDQPSHRVHPDR
jgi:hypothetical protein